MTDDAPAAESLLDERLEIETPERVKIAYDLAGIGSRFAAGTIDVFLLLLLFGLMFVGYLVAAGIAMPRTEETWTAFGLAAGGGMVAVLGAYYLVFEWAWAGQTPGKRLLHLRVLSDAGGPASAGAIFVRNVLRIADLAPFVAPYGLAGVVMFVNKRGKRVGDYAAGTIVVRERDQPLGGLRLPDAGVPEAEGFDAADVARARAFLTRAPQFLAGRRVAIGRRIADELAARHGLTFDKPEPFLYLVASGRTPSQLRDAQGPRP